MFKKLAQHNILCYNEQYFCHLCMCVESNFKNVLDHINSRKHLALKYDEMFNKFIEKYTKEACEEFVDNNVAITAKYNFICIPCQRNFKHFLGALQHIEDNKCHNIKFENGIICDKIKDAIHSCMNNFKLKKNEVNRFDIKLVLEYLNAYQDYESYINNEYNKYTLFEAFKTLHHYTNEEYKTFVNNGIIIYEYFLPICKICNYISCTSDKILNHMKAKHGKVIIKTQQKKDINNDKEEIQHKENVKNNIKKLQNKQNIRNNNNNNEEEKQQKYNINSNEEISSFIDSKSLEKQNKRQDNNKDTTDNINSKINNEKNKLDLAETESTKEIVTIISNTIEIKEKHVNVKPCNCKICNLPKSKKCLELARQELLENKVIICGLNHFFCILCMCNLTILCNILIHIRGKFHKRMLKHHLRFNTFEHRTSADTLIVNYSNSIADVDTSPEYSLSNANCSPDHSANISTHDTESNEILDTSENIASQSSLHYCESCKKQIDINNLFEPSNTIIHRCNFVSMTMGNDTILYKCFCCKSVMQENSLLINHLNSTSHVNNLVKYLKHSQISTTNIFTVNYIENKLEHKILPVCTFLLPRIQDASTNFNERCFLSFDATSNIKYYNDIINNVVYHCLFCSATLNSYHNLIAHCEEKLHLSKIKRWLFVESYSSADDMDTLTKCVNELFISNKDENNAKHENDLIITDNVIKQITKFLSIPLDKKSISKNPKTKEKSLVECLNQKYNKKCLEVEEEMYIVEHKLNSIKANLRFIIPFDKNNFYCLACNERISREIYLLYEHLCIESHKINVCLIKKNKSEILTTEYIQEVRKDMVKCLPCQKCITNDVISISTHTKSLFHINKRKIFTKVIDNAFNSISEDLCNLWYNIQRFCCVLCTQTFKYKIMFIKHIIKKHSESLYKRDYVFNFCIPCTTLWLDKKDSYTEHCKDITHKYLIKSQDFMIEKLPESIKNILMLVDEYSNFLFQQTQQILINDNIQQEVKQSLENILKEEFPTIRAFVFGSRVTGLGFENSDIDIYLDCGNTYSQDICESLRKRNFTIIKQILYLHEKEWKITKVLENSRTPIIKLIYKRTGIQCDISNMNGLSVENSKLIRSFNDAYPPCRKLILFVKKWFFLFNLNERHGLTNYALAWLVIFYLQSCLPKPYLPSVATLIEQNKKSSLISGWETGVAKPKNVNEPQESVSTLLMGFLKFYASFDYQHYVICPLMGQRITKKAFAELLLPMDMEPYIEHLITSENREYFRIDSPLCVQDPFDLAHNLTKAVTNITLKYFKQYCQDSISILHSLAK